MITDVSEELLIGRCPKCEGEVVDQGNGTAYCKKCDVYWIIKKMA